MATVGPRPHMEIFLVAADFKEPLRIEGQDFLNRQLVLAARCGLVLVVIEVRGGQQQQVLVRGKNFGERMAHGLESGELQLTESDGNEGEAGIEHLQKRNLHFEGMFPLVSHRIVGQYRAGSRDPGREFRIDRRITQRSPPGALAKDGGFFPVGKMADAQNDDSPREGNARVDRPGYAAGVHVTGVGHQAGPKTCRLDLRFGRHTLADQRGKRLGLSGIKNSGDGGRAKHGGSAD